MTIFCTVAWPDLACVSTSAPVQLSVVTTTPDTG